MRFLVDRCAGRKLTEWLREQGHDAVFAPELGPDPGDAALLALASRDQRILITIDTDFGRLIFSQGTAHAGIIRLPDIPATSRIAIMHTVLSSYADRIRAGSIITVRGNRIRVSSSQ